MVVRRRRRRTGSLGYSPRAGSLFLSPPKSASRRRRRQRGGSGPSLSKVFVAVVVVAALGYGAYALISSRLHQDKRHDTVEQFTEAWARGDHEAMYGLLDAASRRATPKISFLADYRPANRAAGVQKVTIGKLGPLLSGGDVKVPVAVKTKDFGTLKGTVTFHTIQKEDVAKV